VISTNRFVAHMSTKLRVYHNDHNDRWYTVCKDPTSFRSTPHAVDPATYTYGVSTFPTSYDKGALVCVVMNADTCVVLHRWKQRLLSLLYLVRVPPYRSTQQQIHYLTFG
jgi:hypothetical protein